MPIGALPQHRSPSMQAGKLRHRISIVRVSQVQDATGGFDLNTDVVYANVWASIEALSGTDKFAAHEFISQVTHQVIIRWIGAAPSWQAGFAYTPGVLVVDANGSLQQAQAPGGVSGNTAPAWGLVYGSLTADTNPSFPFNWKNLGAAPLDTGVQAKMQIWYRQRQFQIEAVLNPDERTKMLSLLCIEINDSLQQKLLWGGPQPCSG